jgi:glycosyltransferase involved in cell wall biosynthesis
MAPGGLVSLTNLGPLVHGKQIVCIHDANTYLEPESYSRAFRAFYRLLLPGLGLRARQVTTVSRFSATMLQQFGVVSATKTRVFPDGHEHALRWDPTQSRFNAPGFFKRPFVFALGSRAKHKNLDALLNLSAALDTMGLDLVIAGGSASIFATQQSRSADNIVYLDYVAEHDLAALFRLALCFAFPSRTEGFGLPLLEAMVHQCPIVASDSASMPEVCGDAALYASPHDPNAWLTQIARLHKDTALRNELIANGNVRLPLFSWRKSALAYLELALGGPAFSESNESAAQMRDDLQTGLS